MSGRCHGSFSGTVSTFPTISHQVLSLASAFSRHLNSAPPPTLPSASVLWFRLSSLLSKIILIRVPPSLVRSPLPVYSHSNVNFPKWELDHVTPQLTPGCSLKSPKIESSASCLCSHLPLAPISCHLPRCNVLPSFLLFTGEDFPRGTHAPSHLRVTPCPKSGSAS